MVEQPIRNRQVVGSTPTLGSNSQENNRLHLIRSEQYCLSIDWLDFTDPVTGRLRFTTGSSGWPTARDEAGVFVFAPLPRSE